MAIEDMERPLCQFGGIGYCLRPARWIVGIAHNYKFRLSCDDHRDLWNKGGSFCFVGELKGYLPDRNIEEITRDSQAQESNKL